MSDNPPRPGRLTRITSRRPGREKPLFSFAVVADTHVNEREVGSTSPFQTNHLANERARHAFREIAALDPAPEFVFHLGDIVHPVPSVPAAFQDAVQRFRDIAAPLAVPLHVLPGNHDVGDKRIDWMPADQVCERYLEAYRAAFGADFHGFDHGPLRCLAINSVLLNSGLPDEARQREWLEAQITGAGDRRVFLFMHYPPYIHDAGERGNYDNVDEPARSWLLGQIRRPPVEAVFAGHVHNFWYDRVGRAEMYMLPSTAFLRHDFSEFYRIAPAVEFGRGDAEKFGWFVVDVFADGHVAYLVRTHGGRARTDDAMPAARSIHLAHPKTSPIERVGVQLRHPWAESQQITATGGVQEFGRKWARNDYPLLALWEMGVRLLEVPEIDFSEDASRARMAIMADVGHRFIVTCLGRPKGTPTREQLAAHGVAAFDVNFTLPDFERQQGALAELRARTGAEILFSKIHGFDDSHFDGKTFSHFVKTGFTLDDLEHVEPLVRTAMAAGAIDGITVRIEHDQPLAEAGARIRAFAERAGTRVLASLKSTGANIATELADDAAFAARVREAIGLSRESDQVRYVFDTFMDVDRGYYPRHAFIDRRFDPRAAARVFAEQCVAGKVRER